MYIYINKFNIKSYINSTLLYHPSKLNNYNNNYSNTEKMVNFLLEKQNVV